MPLATLLVLERKPFRSEDKDGRNINIKYSDGVKSFPFLPIGNNALLLEKITT